MLGNLFKNINIFFNNMLEFLLFRTKGNTLLNIDIETCCLHDDTTTYSE